jgi:hypothetical protein
MRTVFTHLFWELMPYGRDVADLKKGIIAKERCGGEREAA